jgi:hypothetical protein
MELFDSLLDDETLLRRPETPLAAVVADHVDLRNVYSSQLATLVVPDSQLAGVARHVPASVTIPVSVIIRGGAGDLLGLTRRKLAGIEIVSAEAGLRNLDDLAGSAARVVSAAAELSDEIAIFVELPYAPRWEIAVEVVEAADQFGKIAARQAEPRQTAEQLSILIEADLPFKITSRSDSSWLQLLAAVDALIDGASVDDATALMESKGLIQSDGEDDLVALVSASDPGKSARIRRRVRRLGADRVVDVINEYAVWQSQDR